MNHMSTDRSLLFQGSARASPQRCSIFHLVLKYSYGSTSTTLYAYTLAYWGWRQDDTNSR
ncbi:hypothetical protein EXIGLDRAFT_355609 [Exidia glandulosa HHB12029]|uniref:Uncharacterized protein n=1 Tax=Exidia glandulosa HHB12029 TaxID=1314781 RepID=A0A166MUM0_EXIGL|nr:hypothetical protein EXIGLDRAFT_34329 [Exidia glandulosa HHB12029]KZV82114.1 hypothetical protein EXIGLDRAFT_355609 [Exidia glandulosa HHB12029]